MTGMQNELCRVVDALPGLVWSALPDGQIDFLWFNLLGLPWRDTQGHILRWFHLQIDIDDRKRAEAQRDRNIEELRAQQSMLSESEQRFRAIFDEAGTGIALADLQQPCTPIQNNRALQTMLGLSQERLGLFETYDEITARDDREADAAAFRELREGKLDSLRQEKHFILRDGSFDGTFQGRKKLIYAPDWPVLLNAIQHAIERSRAALGKEAEIQALRDCYASLTPREREVMALVVSGLLNKQVGSKLGISEITVKAHRGRMMQKMKADSLADLVKMAVRLRLAPARNPWQKQ